MAGQDEQVFGRYVVSARVGEGSLGTVYRARHAELGREAAVKVLRREVTAVPEAVAALRAEATTLARLDHPHVVRLYDFVEEPGRTWLAEQWVDGAPLDVLLDEHRRLTPEQALGVLTGALSGLAHAHDNGIVHRDVAASNVLADLAGTSMLVDFGLAAPVGGTGGSSATGVVGTPAYLSPEAARGDPVGKPGDVYSSAALAHHLLAGVPVFTGTAWEMVAAHRDRVPPRLPDHGPRMASLLQRSLAKDPGVRPRDAGEFLAELEEAADERYGAGWRSRASIAGLVAATAGAGLAVGAAGGAGPTGAAGGLTGAVSGASAAVVDTGRKVGLKVAVAAGATALVVGGGALVWGLTSGEEGGDDAGGTSGGDEPTLSEEERAEEERQERIAELAAAAPTGRYRWVARHVDIQRDGGRNPAPVERGGPWILSVPDCDEHGCEGRMTTKKGQSGGGLGFTWDGSTLRVGGGSTVDRGPKAACIDTVTGETLPIGESAARYTVRFRYQPATVAPDSDGSPPERFTLTRVGDVSWEFFGTCEKGPTDIVQQRTTWVFTRIG